jgi:hypothetical protein
VWYADDPATNDKDKDKDKTLVSLLLDWLRERELEGSLLCFDLGYFAFTLFDELTERECYYVTRLRHKTRYTIEKVLKRRCWREGAEEKVLKRRCWREGAEEKDLKRRFW